jgi:signal transduction histidine kinase
VKALQPPSLNWRGDQAVTTNQPFIQEQLRAIADDLWGSREHLFSAWRQRVEDDPELATVAHFSRSQFVDHMPWVLQALCDKLRTWSGRDTSQESSTEVAAESHSQHRWQQGYDLRSVVSEWGHLNTCLVAQLEHYSSEHPEVPSDVLGLARGLLADFLGDNLTQGVVEYHELLQSEAATRVRELEAALAHLRDLERARGQLLRTVVHDLRGSLGIVTGNLAMLDHVRISDEDRVEMHELLGRGVADLEHMLTQLMDMARLEAGQETRSLELTDVGKLLEELCATTQPLAAERNLYLKGEGPVRLEVESDPLKVRRIAQNLVLNALNYTRQGGVWVSWGEVGERWFLSVRDTGPGFQASTAAPLASKLGAATETAHEVEAGQVATANPAEEDRPPGQAQPSAETHGEGVGLAIVKRLCELLDATLELESEAEVGTTLSVSFPRHYP